LARFTLIFLVVYLVGLSVTSFSPANILGILHDIGIIGLTVCLAIYLIRGVRWLKNRLLWKVRNKIIISFAFVGIFPLILLLAISGLTLSLVLKRMGGIYLANELELIFESMEDTCSSATLSYSRHLNVEEDPLKTVLSDAQMAIEELPAGFDNSFFELYWLSPPDPYYKLVAIISRDGATNLETEPRIGPDWLRDGFTGFVFRGEETNLVTCRDLSQEFRLVLHTPLDQKVLDYLTRRTSIALEVTRLSPNENPSEFRDIHSSFSARQDFFSFLWPHFFAAVVWEDGARASGTILLSVPTGILLDYYFFSQAEPLIPIIFALLIIFLLVELGSIVIGIVIARSITSSIHSIYTGVESIQKGEFHFRINSSNKDQLDAMANSFNDMSSSIVRLMNQVSEREWMEKELEIAKEVQNQLFPQQFPETRYLEISASCTPARQVSGDYYDFLPNGVHRLDIVIGDISGKGISAALMMASLVSIIRSGLNLPQERIQTERIARVVRESNRQFYKRSSPESFSTLVLNHFNAETKTLTYCNAGHHPPLVFSNGDLRELTAGGTVVGLFESWEFIASEIELKSGDLVVYFTDGVVEATNHEGEQFGTERLIQLVGENTFLTAEDVQAMIVEQVFVWADGEEQADDITVLCMKVLE
jgi:sigma-B regulation protein RsbU (phosphoserine phosphatase)